jgi:transcription-repair coupling factor (superfamily II helicase)
MPKHQLISTDARKRLSAIRRCSNLGAGFQLALHDLEIRGAGNILGAEQSGHLNTIGFDLYCHLLKQEVAKLRGEKVEFLPDVDLAIDFISYSIGAPAGMLDAAIPADYIGGERLRLDAYRRLCSLSSEEELDEFSLELIDRFGPMFCHADVINYGNLPYTDFIRTQTLCQGGDKCDFCFIRHAKGEDWERTKSV